MKGKVMIRRDEAKDAARNVEGIIRPLDGILSGLQSIRKMSQGHPQICVAVLDGPSDLSHPCFAHAHLVHSSHGVRTLGTAVPSLHGTHVASILFGQPGSPVEGIAPSCRGLLIPIFRADENGGLSPCSQPELAAAIVDAVEQGAQVINISGGELVHSKLIDPSLERAIGLCAARNILIVAAAGNDGCDCTHIPAGLPPVLAVGALDRRGAPLRLSNWGEPLRRQGIMAPGEAIPGAVPGGGVTKLTGTSFATPIVSGLAALLLSLQVQRGQQPDPLGVREAILASADPCNPATTTDCRRALTGRLNVVGALRHLTSKGGRNRMFESEELYASGDATELAVPASPGSVPLAGELSIQAFQGLSPATFSPSQGGLEPTFAGEVAPSCACGGEAPYLVLPIGNITYDFGSDARLESFRNLMYHAEFNKHPNPWDHEKMVWYLTKIHPEAASQLIWLLSIEGMPKFAIAPSDAYAQKTFELLRDILGKQLAQKGKVERVSIPGVAQGRIRLYSGQEVPIVRPDLRGIYAWSIEGLIQYLQELGELEVEDPDSAATKYTLRDFLNRLYYESINDGVAPSHRAFNIVATRAASIYIKGSENGKRALDKITVEKSKFNRPGSDCWEVTLYFFDPKEPLNRSKMAMRYTYDVADTVPAPVGAYRIWPTV